MATHEYSMTAKIVLTGVEEFFENVEFFDKKMRNDILSKAVVQYTKPIAKAMKANAPVGKPRKWKGKKIKPGRLKKAIGRRHRRYQKGAIHVGMAGVRTTGNFTAPYWHLMEFGTVDRWHKSGKYVGRVPEGPFSFLRKGYRDGRKQGERAMAAKIRERTAFWLKKLPNRYSLAA